MGFGQHGDGCEVEGLERLSGQQACLCEMSFDTTAVALDQFMLDQSAEQPGGGPALLVGLLCKTRPERLDGWQTQFGQSEREAGGIGLGRCHAVTPWADAALLSNWL